MNKIAIPSNLKLPHVIRIKMQPLQLHLQMPLDFALHQFGDVNLVCKIEQNADPCIVITDDVLFWIVCWCHEVTVHFEGMDHLELSVWHHFWHPCSWHEV